MIEKKKESMKKQDFIKNKPLQKESIILKNIVTLGKQQKDGCNQSKGTKKEDSIIINYQMVKPRHMGFRQPMTMRLGELGST